MKERYYLVREDILPDAVLKTMQVKQLLEAGDAKTVNEGVEQVGLSRSAFYKYKDGIHFFLLWVNSQIDFLTHTIFLLGY